MKKKNRRIQVGISKTVNTGNYESMKINAGIEIDISDDDDLDYAYNELFEECTKQVLKYEYDILGGLE